jgi:ferrochelatase
MPADSPKADPHGQTPRTGLLLVNLGTPDAPTASALRRYLGQFLWDHRVVEIPRVIWWLILHGIILRVRPAKSAAKYASVWMKEGSPLRVWTVRQEALLQGFLGERGHQVVVRHAMRYGQPAIGDVLEGMKAEGVTRVLVLPMYPQYSAATTASVMDEVYAWCQRTRWMPEVRHVNQFHDDPGYIGALADSVRKHWQLNGRHRKLVMSFHGMPHRTLLLGDPYHCHCLKTGRLLAQALGLAPDEVVVTFQSRFGRAKWLEPYTEPTLRKLAQEGCESVDVICPGFVADCIETLEEINMEAREAFLHEGGKAFAYIPCLNDQPGWIHALGLLSLQHLQGWPTTAAQLPDAATLQAQCQRAQALMAAQAKG